MKRMLASLTLLLIVSAAPAMAGESCKPSAPVGITSDTQDNNTQRQPFGYGIGADLVVYKGGLLDEITIEPRYDIETRETRVFAVARIDLYALISSAA